MQNDRKNSSFNSSDGALADHEYNVDRFSLNPDAHNLSPLDKTWLRKASDLVRPGSMKGSIFNLVMVTVGSGIITLPYAIKKTGLIPGLIGLILAAFGSYFTVDILIDSASISESRLLVLSVDMQEKLTLSYSQLAELTLGTKGKHIVFASLVFTLWSVPISFFIMIGSITNKVFEVWDIDFSYRHSILAGACLEIPLVLMRDMSSLRFSSMFGLFCSFFLCLALAIEYFQQCTICLWHSELWTSTYLLPESYTDVLKAIPILMFSYCCHMAVLTVYRELSKHNKHHMMKVTRRSLFVITCIYSFVALFGYLHFLKDTEDNILLNDFHHPPIILASAFCLVFSLVISGPLYLNVLRQVTELDEIKFAKFAVFSILILASQALVAAVLPSVSFALELIGSTSLPILCYLIPAAILYYHPSETKRRRMFFISIAILVALISLYNILEKCGIVCFINNGHWCNSGHVSHG